MRRVIRTAGNDFARFASRNSGQVLQFAFTCRIQVHAVFSAALPAFLNALCRGVCLLRSSLRRLLQFPARLLQFGLGAFGSFRYLVARSLLAFPFLFFGPVIALEKPATS